MGEERVAYADAGAAESSHVLQQQQHGSRRQRERWRWRGYNENARRRCRRCTGPSQRRERPNNDERCCVRLFSNAERYSQSNCMVGPLAVMRTSLDEVDAKGQ
ncbi:hypothetical protein MTO96_000280 [Rhipicephalus appendiculatus]